MEENHLDEDDSDSDEESLEEQELEEVDEQESELEKKVDIDEATVEEEKLEEEVEETDYAEVNGEYMQRINGEYEKPYAPEEDKEQWKIDKEIRNESDHYMKTRAERDVDVAMKPLEPDPTGDKEKQLKYKKGNPKYLDRTEK